MGFAPVVFQKKKKSTGNTGILLVFFKNGMMVTTYMYQIIYSVYRAFVIKRLCLQTENMYKMKSLSKK